MCDFVEPPDAPQRPKGTCERCHGPSKGVYCKKCLKIVGDDIHFSGAFDAYIPFECRATQQEKDAYFAKKK